MSRTGTDDMETTLPNHTTFHPLERNRKIRYIFVGRLEVQNDLCARGNNSTVQGRGLDTGHGPRDNRWVARGCGRFEPSQCHANGGELRRALRVKAGDLGFGGRNGTCGGREWWDARRRSLSPTSSAMQSAAVDIEVIVKLSPSSRAHLGDPTYVIRFLENIFVQELMSPLGHPKPRSLVPDSDRNPTFDDGTRRYAAESPRGLADVS